MELGRRLSTRRSALDSALVPKLYGGPELLAARALRYDPRPRLREARQTRRGIDRLTQSARPRREHPFDDQAALCARPNLLPWGNRRVPTLRTDAVRIQIGRASCRC